MRDYLQFENLKSSPWDDAILFLKLEGFSEHEIRILQDLRDHLESFQKIARENERVLSLAKWWYIMKIGGLGEININF